MLPVQERQLQSHTGMLESFKADLSYLQDNPPEGKKAKAKELEERRVRAEYLQHEVEQDVVSDRICIWVCVCVPLMGVSLTSLVSLLQTPQMCRYEIYIHMLDAWKNLKKTDEGTLSIADLNQFDKAVCADSAGEEEEDEEGGLKRAYSSPSLEVEMAPPTVIKVRRNISERRTYRKTVIPRWNKEAWEEIMWLVYGT